MCEDVEFPLFWKTRHISIRLFVLWWHLATHELVNYCGQHCTKAALSAFCRFGFTCLTVLPAQDSDQVFAQSRKTKDEIYLNMPWVSHPLAGTSGQDSSDGSGEVNYCPDFRVRYRICLFLANGSMTFVSFVWCLPG